MAELMLINPRKRHGVKRRKTTSSKRIASPMTRFSRRVKRSRRRRNPINTRGMFANVKPAIQQAAGAVALDVGMGYIPLPVSMQTGSMKALVKGGVALALGIVAAKVIKGDTAKNIATGALASVIRDEVKTLLPTSISGGVNGLGEGPFMPMGNTLDLSTELPTGISYTGNGNLMDTGVSEYLNEYLV